MSEPEPMTVSRFIDIEKKAIEFGLYIKVHNHSFVVYDKTKAEDEDGAYCSTIDELKGFINGFVKGKK